MSFPEHELGAGAVPLFLVLAAEDCWVYSSTVEVECDCLGDHVSDIVEVPCCLPRGPWKCRAGCIVRYDYRPIRVGMGNQPSQHSLGTITALGWVEVASQTLGLTVVRCPFPRPCRCLHCCIPCIVVPRQSNLTSATGDEEYNRIWKHTRGRRHRCQSYTIVTSRHSNLIQY